jgi:hypothetical protein
MATEKRPSQSWGQRRRIALVAMGATGAVILALVASASVIWLVLAPDERFRGMPFESAAWKASTPDFSWESTRLRMVDDFLAKYPPVGLSRSEVTELLGEPDETNYFSEYDLVYFLGMERSYMAIDSEWLVMKLNAEGRVVTAETATD